MPLTPSSTIKEREHAIERFLASICRRMDKALGEVANNLISEGKVEQLTRQAGPSQTLRESSPEPINMQKPWVEGPKGKKVSDSSVLFTSAKVDSLQYLKLQMRYNTEGSSMFIAYRNAKLAELGDYSSWRNARASERACTTCVKRGNTCLH